jgi:hypothetical protein
MDLSMSYVAICGLLWSTINGGRAHLLGSIVLIISCPLLKKITIPDSPSCYKPNKIFDGVNLYKESKHESSAKKNWLV